LWTALPARLQKNTNYWGKTTINGKVYNTPFIDKLVFLIVPDSSTQLSAIQTGKVDMYTQESLVQFLDVNTAGSRFGSGKMAGRYIDVLK